MSSTSSNPVATPSRPVVVTVDNDFPVVIAGLAEMLRPYPDQVHLLPAGEAFADADIILYDTFGATGSLQQYVASAAAKVVVFTDVSDPAAVVEAVKTGVAGYIYKGVSVETLLKTLTDVRQASSPVVALGPMPSPAADTRTRGWPGRSDHLSEREAEILALVCQGLSNKEIAAHLYLSINSVKTYVRLAYRKINVDSRTKALLWGLEHGLSVEGGPQVPRLVTDRTDPWSRARRAT